MPDLVIKPTAGAGNKLILQDQGGGEMVTATDSGLILGGTSKPSSPSAGVTYFNNTLKAACIYDGTMWRILGGGPSGGIIQEYVVGGVSYRSHTYTVCVSSFYLPVTTTIDVLMVGGGGSGGHAGNNYGAGGGAGGMVVRPSRSTTAGTYDVNVGEGGIGPSGISRGVTAYNWSGAGLNGYNTTAFGMTALGGGAGGFALAEGTSGGCGGGSGRHDGAGPGSGTQTTESSISAESRTYGFGNTGGDTLPSGTGSTGKAGAGGGAGSVGNFYRGEEFVPASGQEHYDNGQIGGDGKTNDYRTGVISFWLWFQFRCSIRPN
jgi:hypothetical protein